MAEGTSEMRDSCEDDCYSEDIKTVEMICDICWDNGNNIEAHGYCVDCNDYLCDNCFRYHLKPRLFRNHVLQGSTSMPKQKAKQTVDLVIKQLSACRTHPLKELTSICKTHDQLCCETCVSICHCLCRDVVPIEEVAIEEENKIAIKELDETLANVTKKYQRNIETASANMAEIDEAYQNTLKDVEATLKAIKTKDMEKVKDIKDKSETAHKQLVEWQRIREKLLQNNSARGSFIFRRMLGRQLLATSDNVDKLCSDNSITRYLFIECDHSNGGKLNGIGQIKRTPFLVETISVKHSDDKQGCQIEDIAILPPGKLITIDYANDCVKLVDCMSNSMTSRCELSSAPWNIAVVDSNEVYITLPFDNAILKLTSASEDIGQYTKISLEDHETCYFAKYYNEQLIAMNSNYGVQVLDLEGKVVKVLHEGILNDKLYEGKEVISDLEYADVCTQTGSFYITCGESNSIVEVTPEGDCKVLVQSENLQTPRGIHVNQDETMFICSADMKNILTVSKAGEILGPVLKEPFPFNPTDVAFDQKLGRLYVTGESDSIFVYQL